MERSTKLATLVLSGLLSFTATTHAESPSIPVHKELQPLKGEGIKAGGVLTKVIQHTAKVVAIHYVNRTLSLQAEDGKTIELNVSQDAKNFSNIQTDDLVTVEYLESITLAATKPGSAQADGIYQAAISAAEGEMPAGIETETIRISATVEAIDYETRTILLKSPRGTKTLQVDESAKRFDNISKGDEVHFIYSKAIAISVTKAESNKEEL